MHKEHDREGENIVYPAVLINSIITGSIRSNPWMGEQYKRNKGEDENGENGERYLSYVIHVFRKTCLNFPVEIFIAENQVIEEKGDPGKQ